MAPDADDLRSRIPTRKEPPRFRPVTVRRIDDLTPRMRRVVLGGDDLADLVIDEPAASVRLLLPDEDTGELVMPSWSGNQWELADGERAPIRTFTPRRFDADARELTLDVVVHGGGAAGRWVTRVTVGDPAAISGPGRGYDIDTEAAGYLLAGDETAIPAICQLLEELPEAMPTTVVVEIASPDARLDLHEGDRVTVRWVELPDGVEPGAALAEAIVAMDEVPPVAWVAGEAAAMQKIRTHLFDERGMSRSEATVRGYWKQGRSAT